MVPNFRYKEPRLEDPSQDQNIKTDSQDLSLENYITAENLHLIPS